MKPKNLKEFKALIKRYESITLEKIKEEAKNSPMNYIAHKLTGFGNADTCILCKAWEIGCDECIYNIQTGRDCNCGINTKTYMSILDADTPVNLRNAFRARAKHMKTLI